MLLQRRGSPQPITLSLCHHQAIRFIILQGKSMEEVWLLFINNSSLYWRSQRTSLHPWNALTVYSSCLYSSCLRVVVVYRPPGNIPVAQCLEEFTFFLDSFLTSPGKLLLTGGLNFHVDILDDSAAKQLSTLLDSFNLEQHVKVATHVKGHTLDSCHHKVWGATSA